MIHFNTQTKARYAFTNPRMILEDNGSLFIREIAPQDSGQYECEANYGKVYGSTMLLKSLAEVQVENVKHGGPVSGATKLQSTTITPIFGNTSAIKPTSNVIAEIGSDIPHGVVSSTNSQNVENRLESYQPEKLNGSTPLAPRIRKMTVHVYKKENGREIENSKNNTYMSNEKKVENTEESSGSAKSILLIVCSVILVLAIVIILLILIRILCSL